MGYSPWGCKESDMTESLTLTALIGLACEIHANIIIILLQKSVLWLGLPWWLRQKRIFLQYKRPGFNPLGWEDFLKKRMATHSSILAWRSPWTKEPTTVHGVTKSLTRLSNKISHFQGVSSPKFSGKTELAALLLYFCLLLYLSSILHGQYLGHRHYIPQCTPDENPLCFSQPFY